VHEVQDLAIQSGHFKISGEYSVSEQTVLAILHNSLGMLKVISFSVPKVLTPVQRKYSVKLSSESFGLYEVDS
jgi:hypothetical protein